MSKLDCLNCDEYLIEANFDNLGEDVRCLKCGAEFYICYDESLDGEDEYGWFYLERDK